MPAKPCSPRSSLLSKIRGSFSYLLTRYTVPVGTEIEVAESSINRIYLGFFYEVDGLLLHIWPNGSNFANAIPLATVSPPMLEFTIDTHPGLVQAQWFAQRAGVTLQLTTVEIISGG